MNYFYAYHGPANNDDFEYQKGYGVNRQSTWERVQTGDCVFVIQNPGKQGEYKLCGLYEITGHYKTVGSAYPLRFTLKKVSENDAFITLDEQALNKALPDIEGDQRLSIFKQHFCRQGATFQAPLDEGVIVILSDLLGSDDLDVSPVVFREDGLRMMKFRRGQEEFRNRALTNWENRCAITGSTMALEACHIQSHAKKCDYSLENGIVLAADLHKLFDSGNLSIENNRVILSSVAQQEPRYAGLHTQLLRTPLKPIRI
ncbi:hypothetical protein FCM30_06010 [Lelliottia aquatilis]|jgi:hypothetical protein|uniref:HNH endonuclease n=1 Tax=Lelliottia aquatilis TaxID=2080838 RepID=UPI0015759652|nr:HNH endonuclease [Lelliottia aquatilis]NTZ45322.1 hypothetical protein [Lelliottia aquatilis]